MRADRSSSIWIASMLLAAGALAEACVTGEDPVRPVGSGGGTSSSSSLATGGAGGGNLVGSSAASSAVVASSTGIGGASSSASSSTSSSSTSASSTASSASGQGTSSSASSASSSSSSGAGGASASSSSSAASSSTSSSSSSGGTVGLKLQYLCDNTAASSQQLQPWFQIVNESTSAVELSSLTIRYFYTKDGGGGQNFVCDYAMIGSNNVSAVFGTFVGTNADEYLELHFAAGAGSVAPGGDSGVIQARVYADNYPAMNQTNDYSFDASDTAFTDSSTVTLYQNGTLVWGVEP
jgi:hypothetical protein